MVGQGVKTILERGVILEPRGADSVAIDAGRIVALGRQVDMEPLRTASTRTIDLAYGTLLPGFVDSHTHLLSTGLREIGWETALSGLSRGETLARLSQEAQSRGKDEWIVGRGWDESLWEDGRYLGRQELDSVAPASPLVAVRIDGHLLAANTAALKRLPAGIDPASADLDLGLLWEEAVETLMRTIQPDGETRLRALRAAATLAHRLGITSAHAMIRPDEIPLYLRQKGETRLRVTLYLEASGLSALATLGIQSGLGDDWLRIGGVKVFADGSIGAQNAALQAPYLGSRRRGTLNYTADKLASLLLLAEESHLQTAIHAIGDRAIEQVLRAHESIGSSPALRHRIEHFELATDDQIERAGELGLQISMQPNFVGNWSGAGRMYQARLGRERDLQIDRHRRILDSGIRLAFGSDGMPLSPLYGLHSAVNAPHPDQRVSIEEAISCYTEAGARLSFEEEDKGRIEVGHRADLVVLNGDPRRATERIMDLEVEMTFVGGEPAYAREEEPCA